MGKAWWLAAGVVVLGAGACRDGGGAAPAASASPAGEPGPGDVAPDFSALDETGKPVKLQDLRGKYVVLYSYPRDDTPGCTAEAQQFTAALPQFQALGAVVLGVSAQDAASHVAFKEKHGLSIPLLVDPDQALMKAYGMWAGGNARRMTFLLGPDGKVVRAWRAVNVQGHDAEVLAAIRQHKGA